MTEDATPVAMLATLTDCAKRNHLPAPASAQFRQQQITVKGSCGTAAPGDAAQLPYDDESQMDSEALYAMALGAHQLMVIASGCNENQDLLDAVLTVLTGNGKRPSASIVSNSWQIPLGEVSAQTVHAVDLRAAAEGVGLYFASGDTPGLTVTDSDPYATAVGGTTLGIGAKNNRVFETGWSDDYASVADGKWTDLGVDLGSGGGTSLATPLIAGLVADAQQGQKSDFGFINQLLYRLAGPRAFHDILPVTAAMPQQDRDAYEAGSGLEGTGLDVFDSQEHAYTTQVSAKGYDTMTGIGTPNGAAFIAGLRAAAAS